MERTKRIFPPDDTPNPLIRQDFSESRFQNDNSFSSQARYDHFDTAPYSILRFAAPKKYDFESAPLPLQRREMVHTLRVRLS